MQGNIPRCTGTGGLCGCVHCALFTPDIFISCQRLNCHLIHNKHGHPALLQSYSRTMAARAQSRVSVAVLAVRVPAQYYNSCLAASDTYIIDREPASSAHSLTTLLLQLILFS